MRESLEIAQNPQSDSHSLDQLANSPDAAVRRAVAKNPNTSIATCLKLDAEFPNDPALFVRAASNPNTPPELLQVLFRKYRHVVVSAISQNPHTPTPILEGLGQSDNLVMQGYLIHNPSSPTSVIERLAATHNPKWQTAITAHPNVSPLARDIINFMNGGTKPAIAILERLAQDTRKPLRCLVATFPQTPSSILAILAQDTDKEVFLKVAQHPNLTAPQLEALTKKIVTAHQQWLKSSSVIDLTWGETFHAIVQHPNITAKALASLAELKHDQQYETDEAIRKIIEHPLTPAKTLTMFAETLRLDALANAKGWALGLNTNTPTEALEIMIEKHLAGRHFNSNRALFKILANPNMSPQRIEHIVANSSPSAALRQVLLQNPQTPEHIRQQLSNQKEP
ncbi:hypothetical protein IQ266_23010 [filamentous cyanobacterium LEGE 11480]|uniref:Leucine rich repeat variant n=1 Tax=Romeriopsis navalis LEGE 11480 TaxID=2777977 RepID=A0A928Z6G8_9CYAN|nr:hypothetical protein [Romeriopsis navalis]MBE9032613.1 hypothetical protein [Romeriopsis navalis LEGE 11480]